MPSGTQSGARKIGQGMERLAQSLGAFCLVAIFFLLLIGVVCRMMRIEFYWGSELSGILMAWLTVLCLPWLTRNRAHLSTDIASGTLPPLLRRALRFLGYILMLGYLGVLIWYCGDLALKNYHSGARDAGILRLPLSILQFGVVLGLALTFLSQLRLLFHEGERHDLEQ